MNILSSNALVKKIKRLLPLVIRNRLPHAAEVVSINSKEALVLNRSYRRKNRPANVLSFHYGKDYGEILVCPEVIRREAKAQGNTYKYQMTWMILHGMLHLAGIHHENLQQSSRLAGHIEPELLKKLTGKKSKIKYQKSK